MKCIECKSKLDLVFGNDDPNSGIAYNVYNCSNCYMVMRQNVWNDPGEIWINPKGHIIRDLDQTLGMVWIDKDMIEDDKKRIHSLKNKVRVLKDNVSELNIAMNTYSK